MGEEWIREARRAIKQVASDAAEELKNVARKQNVELYWAAEVFNAEIGKAVKKLTK